MSNVTRYEFEIHEGGGEVITSERGGFVDYDDYLSVLQQNSTLQLSQDNIINGLGITGDGPVSKSVIEYVMGLVAENAALKSALSPQAIPDEALEAFGNTAEFDHDSCEAGSWSWVKNDSEVILAVFKAMPKPETPNTDAFTAELHAQGADIVLRALVTSDDDDFTDAPAICANVAANLRAGRKG